LAVQLIILAYCFHFLSHFRKLPSAFEMFEWGPADTDRCEGQNCTLAGGICMRPTRYLDPDGVVHTGYAGPLFCQLPASIWKDGLPLWGQYLAVILAGVLVAFNLYQLMRRGYRHHVRRIEDRSAFQWVSLYGE
jgi:hypothetical protein